MSREVFNAEGILHIRLMQLTGGTSLLFFRVRREALGDRDQFFPKVFVFYSQ